MFVLGVFYLLAMFIYTNSQKEAALRLGFRHSVKENLSGGGLWLDARKMNKLYVGEVGFILGAE